MARNTRYSEPGDVHTKISSPVVMPKSRRVVKHYHVFDHEITTLGTLGLFATLFLSLAAMATAFLIGAYWDIHSMGAQQVEANEDAISVFKWTARVLLLLFLGLAILFAIIRGTTVRAIKRDHSFEGKIESGD